MKKVLFFFLLFCSISSAQNVFISAVGDVPIPNCTGLYHHFISSTENATENQSMWVRSDGFYSLSWNTIMNRWYVYGRIDSVDYYWKKETSASGYFFPAGVYVPHSANVTNNVSVYMQEDTASLLAPSMVTNLQVISSTASNQLSILSSIDSASWDTQVATDLIKDDIDIMRDHTFDLMNTSVDMGQSMSNLVSLGEDGTQTVFVVEETLLDSPWDIDVDLKNLSLEHMYAMTAALYESDEIGGRNVADQLEDIWDKLNSGIVDVEIQGAVDILDTNLCSVLWDVKEAVTDMDLAVNSNLVDGFDAVNSNLLRNTEFIVDALTNIDFTVPTIETNFVFDSALVASNINIVVSDITEQVESVNSNVTAMVGITNFMYDMLAFEMPEVGTSNSMPFQVNFDDINDSPLFTKFNMSLPNYEGDLDFSAYANEVGMVRMMNFAFLIFSTIFICVRIIYNSAT